MPDYQEMSLGKLIEELVYEIKYEGSQRTIGEIINEIDKRVENVR